VLTSAVLLARLKYKTIKKKTKMCTRRLLPTEDSIDPGWKQNETPYDKTPVYRNPNQVGPWLLALVILRAIGSLRRQNPVSFS